jgi:MSHA biogenesis protein MshJ
MAGLSALKAQWHAGASRFDALQRREKLMVSAATLLVILLGGYSFWIEPAQIQKTRLHKAIAQQQAEQAQLTTQLAALAAQAGDPDAINRTVLAQLQQQLLAAERDIRDFDRLLVAPAQAPVLLQTLLAKHRGLTLVSLTTLAPQPLIARPAGKEDIDTGGNIYKHGIEIKLAGGYHDLLAYVDDLEKGTQKILRGDMKLAVQQHPVSELTLTVYTLSLESTWLVV